MARSVMNIVNFDATFDLEYFFDLSPDLICIAGYDGYFKKVNPAALETLGYSYEELLASPINSFVHPNDQEITSMSRLHVKNDKLLLDFENRYITKSGDIVWLSWTTKLIKRDELIFGIAKKINHKKITDNAALKLSSWTQSDSEEQLRADRIWLNNFEQVVKKYIGKMDLSVTLLSDELAMSERQLFRRVKRVAGITPNRLIRNIRLEAAFFAISTGKYTTLAEISNIAGFNTPAYFNKLFREVYGFDVLDLLNKIRI
jgi:PAS domain S-box-containing protein